MKYIIDVDKDRLDSLGQLYIAVDIPNSQLSYEIPTGIWVKDYTEPDRKAIEDEVWKFAKKVRLKEFFDDNHNLHPYLDYFDSYQDAKAKHEELKRSEDEIYVGDEVVNHLGRAYIIYHIDKDKQLAYGIDVTRGYPLPQETFPTHGRYTPNKTGRRFPEIGELLKKMKKELYK